MSSVMVGWSPQTAQLGSRGGSLIVWKSPFSASNVSRRPQSSSPIPQTYFIASSA